MIHAIGPACRCRLPCTGFGRDVVQQPVGPGRTGSPKLVLGSVAAAFGRTPVFSETTRRDGQPDPPDWETSGRSAVGNDDATGASANDSLRRIARGPLASSRPGPDFVRCPARVSNRRGTVAIRHVMHAIYRAGLASPRGTGNACARRARQETGGHGVQGPETLAHGWGRYRLRPARRRLRGSSLGPTLCRERSWVPVRPARGHPRWRGHPERARLSIASAGEAAGQV